MSLEKAIELLWYWQCGGDSFTCDLYSLMMKADGVNLAKLSEAYPTESTALFMWKESKDPKEFFATYNLGD